jgi:hypothetical protein
MPNFDAKIRMNYSDIENLILDCKHTGLADTADGSLWTNVAPPKRPTATGTHTGANNSAILSDSAQNWRTNELVGRIAYNITDGSLGTVTANGVNSVSATLSGGTDNDWDTGDSYKIADPRFGNPYQDTAANRPTVSIPGSYWQAEFTKASSEFMKIPLDDTIPAGRWTAAFEYLTKAPAGNNHPVLYFPNWSIWRQNAAGNYKYRHGAVDVNGAGDMTAGTWALWWTSATTGALYRNGVSSLSGSASNQGITAADPAGYLCFDGGANYCDMILRTVAIWNRMLSPLELDFAYQTMSPEFDYAQWDRATMSVVPATWSDDTGVTDQEISRINPTTVAPHFFHTASFPAGGFRRVQIAASVDGVVLPDTGLGGDLFEIKCIEHASAGHPAVYWSTGYSAIFDVLIDTEGHYTFAVHRDNSGTIVLHLDAVEV